MLLLGFYKFIAVGSLKVNQAAGGVVTDLESLSHFWWAVFTTQAVRNRTSALP